MTLPHAALAPIPEAERERILHGPRTAETHHALMAEIPAMSGLEIGGDGPASPLPGSFPVVAWNVERCLFPEASAAHLLPHNAPVVLLSEMDSGMARTGQRNTTAAMAKAMQCHYAFGVEFFEMGLGSEIERGMATDSHNALGWHGNAILSATPFIRAVLIRLDDSGMWYATGPEAQGNAYEPRVGGRMAVAAELATELGPVCVVTTHLESNADAAYRHDQFARLLDGVEAFAPGVPTIIGGDLNTGGRMKPDYDWRRETLFDLARDRGYSWDASPEGVTLRSSLLSPKPKRKMRLDWICTRGLRARPGAVLPSLDPTGRPLSDHEAVLGHVAMPGADTGP